MAPQQEFWARQTASKRGDGPVRQGYYSSLSYLLDAGQPVLAKSLAGPIHVGSPAEQ